MSSQCLVCERIKNIQDKINPYFVTEFETGYVVLGDFQYFKGYTLFLCKQHKTELHQLESNFKMKFLQEMSMVAEAVFLAFKPKKLNYELLGNTVSHLHWHIFPRYDDDPVPGMPIWGVDSKIRCSEQFKLSSEDLVKLKEKLFVALKIVGGNKQ
jgi:diadenosine tetraphosphate (Ap4A) HIT family hydrolase